MLRVIIRKQHSRGWMATSPLSPACSESTESNRHAGKIDQVPDRARVAHAPAAVVVEPVGYLAGVQVAVAAEDGPEGPLRDRVEQARRED